MKPIKFIVHIRYYIYKYVFSIISFKNLKITLHHYTIKYINNILIVEIDSFFASNET